ncbi:hypothetical protein CCACVL1_02177 [Corchorus capsularis]|uniref:Ty3 transposon capsid-like protein domain-containing protein n=1 Tax=Corchorus capsularis TaxID=210143 RepID=A0A1R3KB32_COCAP|nr:hypothetical protein CCACVL1_02177 [Corchorus capsularis]
MDTPLIQATSHESTSVVTVDGPNMETFKRDFKAEILDEFRDMLDTMLAKRDSLGKKSVGEFTPEPPPPPPYNNSSSLPPAGHPISPTSHLYLQIYHLYPKMWHLYHQIRHLYTKMYKLYPFPPISTDLECISTTYMAGPSLSPWHTGNPYMYYPKPYKIDLPKFSGENFKGWYLKLEQYFVAERVPEYLKVKVTLLALEDNALAWDQFYINSQGGLDAVTWDMYLAALKDRFACEEFSNPLMDLVQLKQTCTINEFHYEFMKLLALVKNIDGSQALSISLANLKPDIAQKILLHRPATINHALKLANLVEKSIEANAKRGSSVSKGSYASPVSTSTYSRPSLPMLPAAKSSSTTLTTTNKKPTPV